MRSVVVEGPIPTRCEDVRHHAVKIRKNLASSNPERLEPSFAQFAIADLISCRVRTHPVRLAIHFDGQPAL
jgi:hypothetical protein